MTEDQNRLLFEAGRAAVNRGWSDAEVVSDESLDTQTPAGPPLIIALSSTEVTAGTAKDLSALAGAGRRVLLVTDQPLPDAVLAWLPTDSWIVADSHALTRRNDVGEGSVDRREDLQAVLLESLLTGEESEGVQQYLAGDRNTPCQILARLATVDNQWAICNLAGNPSAPSVFLDDHLDTTDSSVLLELARNAAIPLPRRQELMRRLARMVVAEESEEILGGIPDLPRDVFELVDEAGYLSGEWIYNESIPANLLLKILTSGVPELYLERGFARRSFTPELAVRALASAEHDWVRKWAAMPCDAPADVLSTLAGDASQYVRMWVAENPGSTVETLIRLLNDPDEGVRSTAAVNPTLPLHLAQARTPDIAATPCGDDLAYSIDMGRVSAYALTALASHPEPRIRSAVARCPVTPADTLAPLSADEDSAVRWGVARNRKAPARLRAEMLHADASANGGSTTNIYAAREIASQEDCPDEVLRVLARDSDPEVRAAVIVNPATHLTLLEAMAISKDRTENLVSQTAGNDPSRNDPGSNPAGAQDAEGTSPPSTVGDLSENRERLIEAAPPWIATIAMDSDEKVRMQSAERSSTQELLRILALDASAEVRAAAAANPRTPSTPEARNG